MAEQMPDHIEQVKEKTHERTQGPPMYRVIIFNDDFTTKEFVVEILVCVFHKGIGEATELMWRVHRRGSGIAGVYPLEIAETKVATVVALAREQEYPLRLSIEPDN
jgi:ATP-dependent Clp protease adaptor protein ClpS